MNETHLNSSPVLVQPALQLQPRELRRPISALPAETLRDVHAPAPVIKPVATSQDAWQSGFEKGQAAGYDAGMLEGLSEGRRQGLEEGRAEGLRVGLEQARERLETELAALQTAAQAQQERLLQLLQTLPIALAQRLEQAEDDMVTLVHAAVLQFLGESAGSIDGCRQVVRKQLDQFQARGPLVVRVHPEDVVYFAKDQQISQVLASGVTWSADPSVTLGGCIIQTPDGDLDARLETQMRIFAELLVDIRRKTAAGVMA